MNTDNQTDIKPDMLQNRKFDLNPKILLAVLVIAAVLGLLIYLYLLNRPKTVPSQTPPTPQPTAPPVQALPAAEGEGPGSNFGSSTDVPMTIKPTGTFIQR